MDKIMTPDQVRARTAEAKIVAAAKAEAERKLAENPNSYPHVIKAIHGKHTDMIMYGQKEFSLYDVPEPVVRAMREKGWKVTIKEHSDGGGSRGDCYCVYIFSLDA